MKKDYATELTKDYLQSLGITKVDALGNVYKGMTKLNQHFDGCYYSVRLYDPAVRQAIPAEERTSASGGFSLGVHRICYAWWNGSVPAGMVVDHINNDKTDNNIFNLQLLTPGENIWKERECNKTEIKCKLNKPRSFYEDKLNEYKRLYNEALELYGSVSEECHKLRTNIAQTRARLRYYDNHIEEAKQIKMEKDEELKQKKEKKENTDYRKKAIFIKEYHQNHASDLWHYWASISRQKTFTAYDKNNIDSVYSIITK